MICDKVNVIVKSGEIPVEEIQNYIDYIKKNNPGKILKDLELALVNEEVEMKYSFVPVEFERIRRITGYLVGTTERWNNAKRAEEIDRVKHVC